MSLHLRDYQTDALTALRDHRREHPAENRLAIEMATGLGKTITFAAEARDYLDSYEGAGNRVLILVHTDELTSQAERKVRLMSESQNTDGAFYSVGVVKAERDETDADIIIGSVQTLANAERRCRITDVGLIIVDECHHAVSPTYRAILEHFGGMAGMLNTYPYVDGLGVPVTGYTATLERGDRRSLAPVFHDVAFTRGISWAVRKGFLVQPRGYRVEIPDLQLGMGLRTIMADDMDAALVDSIAPERVVDAWIEHAKGRSTVLFAPLVRSAEAFCQAFRAHGIAAAVIHGNMPTALRAAHLRAYERGDLDVLCNAMVLTEGWDSPRTKCVIVARPTQSRPLFIQMAGRGLRPWLDAGAPPREEQDCILLVVADATTELCTIADLSDKPIEAQDGKSLLQIEDEFDLSKELEPDPEYHWAGVVITSEFDPLVARSSKVWGTTQAGTLFVPAGAFAYVFVAPDREGWLVATVEPAGGRFWHRELPDTELAMALAEDVAVDLGGDIGKLYADKRRAWRKGRPTAEQIGEADRLGLTAEVDKIMASKRAGKAGKVSDLISRVKASRRIDPVVAKIKQRTGQA